MALVIPATHTLIHEWNKPSCLYSVNIHQMVPPERGKAHPITAQYAFIDLESTKGKLAWLADIVADGLPT